MSRTKEIGTAAGTLVCALGIGFAMQNTDAATKRYGDGQIDPVRIAAQGVIPSGGAAAAVLPDDKMEVADITLTSALPSQTRSEPTVSPHGTLTEVLGNLALVPDEPVPTPNLSFACDILVIASAQPGAIVELTVEAPCNGNQAITVHHNGLMFKERTRADGSITVKVPAMAENAVYILGFETGEGAVAHTQVSGLEGMERVALQWSGDAGFELHAREFGASYGDSGHVWHQALNELTHESGHFIRLGDVNETDALIADVYTLPIDASIKNGRVALTVEAEVTSSNCGHQVEAEAMQFAQDNRVETKTLNLTLPACEAIGNYLVLNNVFDPLKVASR